MKMRVFFCKDVALALMYLAVWSQDFNRNVKKSEMRSTKKIIMKPSNEILLPYVGKITNGSNPMDGLIHIHVSGVYLVSLLFQLSRFKGADFPHSHSVTFL